MTTKLVEIPNVEIPNVENVYDKIALEFSTTRSSKWPFISQFVKSITKNSKILDIGCGNGRNMMYDGFNFNGIDISEEFVKICINRGLNVKKGTMTSLPFEDNTFDVILSIAAYHHLKTEEERIKALHEMSRVLRPGGLVLLYVWSKKQPPETRRVFPDYGDVLVPWKSKKNGEIYNRYYYIFQITEIKNLILSNNFTIELHTWNYGNEIFIMKNIK